MEKEHKERRELLAFISVWRLGVGEDVMSTEVASTNSRCPHPNTLCDSAPATCDLRYPMSQHPFLLRHRDGRKDLVVVRVGTGT